MVQWKYNEWIGKLTTCPIISYMEFIRNVYDLTASS